MCLIVYRPADKAGCHMPTASIDASLARHPDGFGIAWRAEGSLHVKRYAPVDKAAFRDAVKAVDAAGHEYVAHFRFATSGPKDANAAHPYTYEDPDPAVGTVLVFHNGIIDIEHNRAAESDTSAFTRLVLARLPSRWWTNPALVFLVSEAIGWSKLVLMTGTETVNLNPKRGTFDGGLWYSSPHKASTWTEASTPGMSPKGYTPHTAAKSAQAFLPPVVKGGDAKAERRAKRAEDRAAKRAARPAKRGALRVVRDPAAVKQVVSDDRAAMLACARAFRHGGHSLTVFADLDLTRDSDYPDSVTCNTCMTQGDTYVIDGQAWFDIDHTTGALAGHDDLDQLPF